MGMDLCMKALNITSNKAAPFNKREPTGDQARSPHIPLPSNENVNRPAKFNPQYPSALSCIFWKSESSVR
ncbi:hypothetical protein L1887_18239 [Cichorium endivia]|nr:hypothetical protein L1887_18239 [Cichorium endivia]